MPAALASAAPPPPTSGHNTRAHGTGRTVARCLSSSLLLASFAPLLAALGGFSGQPSDWSGRGGASTGDQS
eukprot:gene18501-biopygen6921